MGLMFQIKNVFPEDSGKNIHVQAPGGEEYTLGPGDSTPRIPVEKTQNMTIDAKEIQGCAVQFKKTCSSFNGLVLGYKPGPDNEWTITNLSEGLAGNGDDDINISIGDDDQ